MTRALADTVRSGQGCKICSLLLFLTRSGSTASDDQRAPRQLSVGLLAHKWYTTILNAEGTVHSAHPTGRRWSPHLEVVSVRPRMLLAASLLCHCLCTKYILRMSVAIVVTEQYWSTGKSSVLRAFGPSVRTLHRCGHLAWCVLLYCTITCLSCMLRRVLLKGRSGTTPSLAPCARGAPNTSCSL